MEIIGILGFKGCGKDTAAQPLLDIGFKKYAFADAIKDVLAVTFCWDREMLEGLTAESRQWRETVDVWWAERLGMPHFTPRFAMTNIGSDVLRKYFHDSLWVLNTIRRIELDGVDKAVLTDCRFKHETKALAALGAKFIRVDKLPPPFWNLTSSSELQDIEKYNQVRAIMKAQHPDVHESEWAWNHLQVDAIVKNNSTKEAMWEKVITWRNSWI